MAGVLVVDGYGATVVYIIYPLGQEGPPPDPEDVFDEANWTEVQYPQAKGASSKGPSSSNPQSDAIPLPEAAKRLRGVPPGNNSTYFYSNNITP